MRVSKVGMMFFGVGILYIVVDNIAAVHKTFEYFIVDAVIAVGLYAIGWALEKIIRGKFSKFGILLILISVPFFWYGMPTGIAFIKTVYAVIFTIIVYSFGYAIEYLFKLRKKRL